MRSILSALILLCGLPLASCSSIPDQADATRLDTVDIINRIRCEAAESLRPYDRYPRQREYVIAFLFDFDTEQNKNAAGDATLTWPIGLGTFAIGFDGGVENKRYGAEKIGISETFTSLKQLNCRPRDDSTALIYPITGTIGLADVIDKYIEMRNWPSATVTDYIRTLRFTVKWHGGIHPEWTLVRSSGTKIGANIDLAADRTDIHELKIGITPVPTKEEILAAKTTFVQLVTPKAGEPGARMKDGEVPSAIEVAPPLEETKRRALRNLLEDQRLDTFQEIDRRLAPYPF